MPIIKMNPFEKMLQLSFPEYVIYQYGMITQMENEIIIMSIKKYFFVKFYF